MERSTEVMAKNHYAVTVVKACEKHSAALLQIADVIVLITIL